MKVTLDLRKSVDENAQRYFEAAKRARKKAKGAEKVIAQWRTKKAEEPLPKKQQKRVARKKAWFEKFRWCHSSDNFLLIGGRDATTNEIIVKKHAEPGDMLFHTDMAGSPFVVIKAEGKRIPQSTLDEAAQLCASFSRAWRNGLSSLDVFHVAPEQVTKEAQSGEFLPKGAFMIRGKTTYHKPLLKVHLGLDKDGRVMAGPPAAVAAHCTQQIEVLQGNQKASDVAKQIKRSIGGELDEIIAALPPGGCKLAKQKL